MAGIDRGATKLKIEKPRRDGVCAFVGTNPNIQLQRASVGRLTTDARRFRRSKLKNGAGTLYHSNPFTKLGGPPVR